MADNSEKRDRSQGGFSRPNYTAYDRDLIRAAKDNSMVHLALADGSLVSGLVKSVDKFHIELEHSGKFNPYREWFSKTMIVRTRVER